MDVLSEHPGEGGEEILGGRHRAGEYGFFEEISEHRGQGGEGGGEKGKRRAQERGRSGSDGKRGGRISPIAFDILLIKKMPDSLTGPVFNLVIHNIC
jgi:hypothetical protein